MTKRLFTILTIVFVSILACGCGENQSSTIERLKKQLEREEERTDSYKAEVQELEDEIDAYIATVDSLNAELGRKDSTIYSLNQQVDSLKDSSETTYTKVYTVNPGDSNSYLATKFWFDGKEYYSDTTWYSDISCQTSIKYSVTIISPVVDPLLQSNGYTVYCCMSNNGVVYSSSDPNLKVAN